MPTEASGDEQIFRLLLRELGESMSLPKVLEPDGEDSCHVLFDEKVAVEFRRDAGWLVLFSALGEFDTSDRPDRPSPCSKPTCSGKAPQARRLVSRMRGWW